MSVAADQVVHAVVGRLDREALVDEVFAIYVERFESYAALPADLLDGPIRDGGLANIDLVLTLLADDRDALDRCRAAAQAALQGRLQAGVTVEDSLKSLRVAAEQIWQAAVAAASPEELPALVRSAGRLLAFLSVIGSAAGTHAQALDTSLLRVERRSRALLDALLDGSARAPETERLARALGFPLADRYRAFTLLAAGAAQTPKELAAELRRRSVLAVVQRDHVIGLAPEALAHRAFPRETVVALSDPVGASELRSTIEQMHEFAGVALRAGRSGVVVAGDLVPERLLAASPGLSRLVIAEVLAPLEADAGGRVDLVSTLLTHVECDFDHARTAEALHLQPSSLRYRLERITELTGKRFDRVVDLTALTLAAKAHRLDAGERGADADGRLVRGANNAPALPRADDDSGSPV